MGERTIRELANRLDKGETLKNIKDVPQTVFFTDFEPTEKDIVLYSYEECIADKKKQALNFRHIEEESNKVCGKVIWQKTGEKYVRVNPMYPPMETGEIDKSFDLPYTRLPHPRYKGKTIPAYDMIRHSVNLHRGCFGGCAFCTISAHQGKFISSRSKRSVLDEVKKIVKMQDFKGYLSDLGGPSANMYSMGGYDKSICAKCVRPSCLHPTPCKNLNNDHAPLLDLYKSVDAIDGVKKSFIGSGVRYDLAMFPNHNAIINQNNREYLKNLITHHVSGRLKVAPEHTSDKVLNCMRKPSFSVFYKFRKLFEETNREAGLNQQLIPYFISSHPACEEIDMAELAVITKNLNFHLEQVQDFTPTPMTLATEIYYTGYHPYSGEKVYTARTEKEKLDQRQFFFWYKPDAKEKIVNSLRRLGRKDLIESLYGHSSNGEKRSKLKRKIKNNKSSDKNK